VDRDRVLELLDAHDLVVLPSRYETFGSAAFEAMIRGRPTLVSPNCGITRWEGLSRGLFVMEEGEELVEAVDRVRELPAERRTEVVERGVREARAMLRATVENWLDVLASTAARGSRR
jgi:glycosyltransferase involved in cell wall biosynthesis